MRALDIAAGVTRTAALAADPDIAARRALRRYRAVATALLVLMGGLTLASYALPPGIGRDLLAASAKAGFIGGLADWFAIVALFRRPLGLPIPHTAILPAQKVRLGQALGRFVATHVFTADDVARTMARFDAPGLLARLLSEPATVAPMARGIAAMLPRLLASVEDGRARRMLARLIPRLVGGPNTGRVLARALHGLVEGGRHQEVFDFVLTQLRATIADREAQLRQLIEERVREQGGRLVGWALGASIATRVLAVINSELEKMGPDGSELRAAFDEWVRREIQRIEEDPERAAEIGRAMRQVVAHQTVQAWMWDVWSRLRLALEADAAKPSGHVVSVIEAAIGNLGQLITTDSGTRAGLQAAAERIVRGLLPAAQAHLATFIAEVIAQWDARTITEKLELRVGKDLQYIRVNGTLVGFLAGGALFLLLRALFAGSAP